MKHLFCVCVVVGALAAPAVAADRTWKSADGKYTIKAEFAGYSADEEKVQLRKADGKVIYVALAKLSEADQRYVKANAGRVKPAAEPARESDADGDGPAAADDAGPKVCTLKLKYLSSPARSMAPGNRPPADAVYRASTGQRFIMHGAVDRVPPNFTQTVKKEPDYESKLPLRGAVKLGDDSYAFAVDVASGIGDKGKTKPKAKPKPKNSRMMPQPPPEPGPPSGVDGKAYNRLYFDFNRNGDLTDDEPVDGDVLPGGGARSIFPCVEVSLNVNGKPSDYAFCLMVSAQEMASFRYVSASLTPAVYREGEVTLAGKRHRVAVLDYNTNGRFDDQVRILEGRGPSGRTSAMPGDLVLVDPDTAGQEAARGDALAGRGRQYLSKLLNVGDGFYGAAMAPVGDTLTLTACTAAVGRVKNPNDGFHALVYSNLGVVNLSGDHARSVPLPEGDWKLAQYTIAAGTAREPAVEPRAKKTKANAGAVVRPVLSTGPRSMTFVTAAANGDYKPVTVRKGQSVELPFGPPYKPVVNAYPTPDGKTVRLQLSLVGVAGEVCTNLLVNGSRGEPPQFTISTTDGDVVERGKFEYG
jgi:hypothetical protein